MVAFIHSLDIDRSKEFKAMPSLYILKLLTKKVEQASWLGWKVKVLAATPGDLCLPFRLHLVGGYNRGLQSFL